MKEVSPIITVQKTVINERKISLNELWKYGSSSGDKHFKKEGDDTFKALSFSARKKTEEYMPIISNLIKTYKSILFSGKSTLKIIVNEYGQLVRVESGCGHYQEKYIYQRLHSILKSEEFTHIETK